MSHWSGMKPLVLLQYQYWDLSGTPLGYPIVLSHGDPATLGLQDQTLEDGLHPTDRR